MNWIVSLKTAFLFVLLRISLLVFGCPFIIMGQNLIPNPDFEQNTGLPTFLSGFPFVVDWDNGNSGITTPDYFHAMAPVTGAASLPNTLFGSLNAQSGSGIMGFYAYINTGSTEYREYIQAQLTTPLVPGQVYRVSFWVSIGDGLPFGRGGSDGLGIHFSDLPIGQNTYGPFYTGNLLVTPDYQASTIITNAGWQNIDFIYTPTTAVEYITVGNFKSDAQTSVDGQTTISYFFVDNFSLVPWLEIVGPDSICEGDMVTFQAVSPSQGGSFVWKDVQNPSVTLSNLQNFNFVPTNSGMVMCISGGDTAYHSYTVLPSKGLELGADTILCQGTSLTLTAPWDSLTSILWNTGDTTEQIVANSPGVYSVEINYAFCSEKDTIELTSLAIPQIDLGGDTTLCVGEFLSFDFSNLNADLLWMDGDTQSIKVVSHTGLISLLAGNQCGSSEDSISLSFYTPPTLELGADTILCNQTSFVLSGPSRDSLSYLWNTGSTNASIVVSESGVYRLNLSTYCGDQVDSVFLEFKKSPDLNLGVDRILCEGDRLNLSPGVFLADYLWDDGSNESTRNIDREGVYWVIAANECGVDADSIEIASLSKPIIRVRR